MKKIFLLVLVCALTVSALAVPALAASDATITKDTTLSKKFNSYQNLTINSGVTLTTKMAGSEPQGIEMHGALTLGEGAKIVGSGIILMYRGSSYSGITFYYNYKGEYRTFPDIATAYEKYKNSDDYVFTFSYNASAGGWVWTEAFNGGDPFAPPPEQNEPAEDGVISRDLPVAGSYAEALKALGLMQGVGTKKDGTTDFALNKDLTRVQAVVMMIRLLGKEQEAVSGTWSHPFTDVPAWADAYVGYAYEKNITNGVSADRFGSNNPASAAMYITFILRAMGYSDDAKSGAVDFSWKEAPYFAQKLGINLDEEQLSSFKRAQAAIASFYAIRANCKDGTPLFEKLIARNVFTRDQYNTVMNPYQDNRG